VTLAEDLLVSASAGIKAVSVTAPERDRFYVQLGQFLLREAESDGMPERVVLVVTETGIGYFDWTISELDFDSSSNDCFARMATGKPSLNTGKFSEKTVSSYKTVASPSRTCLVIEDAHYHLRGNNSVFLALRAFTDPKQNPHEDRMIILLSESRLELNELVNEVSELRLGYPDAKELDDRLVFSLNALGMGKSDITGDRSKIVEAARGLTLVDAEMTFKTVAVQKGRKLPPDSEKDIMSTKKKIISRTGALEYIDSVVEKKDVGGLEILMRWLDHRADLLKPRPKERNIPSPKGVLFIGVPGSGKSLTAKVVSTIFSRPLVRFDVAACYGSYIGQSEETLQNSLDVAEAVAPCVLWIDELDKALAGGASSGGDNGVSARVFGNLLTWMSEKESDVFIVATANNLDSIMATNPELFRKGRFDQIFFLDYPNHEARKEIFRIHLEKRAKNAETQEEMKDSIDIAALDLEELASKTRNWTGSEIEWAVIGSLIAAHNDDDRVLAQGDVLDYIVKNPAEYSRLTETMATPQDGTMMTSSGIDRMREVALRVGVSASKDEGKR
jgi:ATP-dependent 26S proteasome regulatory subunit